MLARPLPDIHSCIASIVNRTDGRMSFYEDVIAAVQAELPDEDMELIKLYALLALVRRMEVTPRDAHDAWAMWVYHVNPLHRSLVPFDELTPEVQALDFKYVKAIKRAVVNLRRQWGLETDDSES